MKTISIINLKGGVAKTISAVNMAHILAVIHNKRVLLVDNDKQGDTSKFFGVHNYDKPSIAEVLSAKDFDIRQAIIQLEWGFEWDLGGRVQRDRVKPLDVLPANMNLLRANKEILIDASRPQQTRLRAALKSVAGDYDYCIIDNAPDLNISTINALVASDDVLIPIKIDKFAFDGLAELKEQIDNTREDLNPGLNLRGCFVTCYQNNEVNRQGKEWLREQRDYPVFRTHIRRTEKVDESTFVNAPIIEYSRWCNASRDYIALVEEYLNVSNSDTQTEGGV